MLEGGDIAVMGKDILVGVNREIKSASNDWGVRWLQQYLGDSYRVQAVPLTAGVLHLDDGFAAVREGLAIILREQFAEGLPKPLRDWEFVEVSRWEALNYLAGNGMVLGPSEIIIDERLPKVAEALARHGVTVHTIAYDAVTPWSGGLRCSHHPIIRELD
jgi:N-dimethylarginine dimethylaminohydrolase